MNTESTTPETELETSLMEAEGVHQDDIKLDDAQRGAGEGEHDGEDEAGEARELEPGVFWSARVEEIGQERVVVSLGDGAQGVFDVREARAADKSFMIKVGDEIEVLVDEKAPEGVWLVSMEKAEKVRVFNRLTKLAKERTTVKGVITRQVRGGLSVDIGVRAFLPGQESGFRREDAQRVIGQRIICQIQSFDRQKGEVVLTRKSLVEKADKAAKAALYERIKVGDVVTGVVSSVTKFGAFVDIGGSDGLLHATEMSWDRVGDPASVVSVGDELEVQIIELDSKKDRIGLSRKALVPNPWLTFAADHPEGSRASGVVTSLTDFGAFVDIGGVEGLVHVSELSWDRNVRSAKGFLEKGQKVEVFIKEFDVENQRISLSLKRLEENPWSSLVKSLEVGGRVKGKVRSVVDFGVFVEVLPGVEGLLHVSDLSWTERLSTPHDFRDFQEGEEVEVVVLGIDMDRGRVSLGVKQLTREPWEAAGEGLRKGGVLEVTIVRTMPFGAFATIVPGLEGLIHVSELAVDRVDRVEDVVKPGQTVKVRVLEADRKKGKVSLSIKAFLTEEGGAMTSYTEQSTGGTSFGALLKAQGLVQGEPEAPAPKAPGPKAKAVKAKAAAPEAVAEAAAPEEIVEAAASEAIAEAAEAVAPEAAEALAPEAGAESVEAVEAEVVAPEEVIEAESSAKAAPVEAEVVASEEIAEAVEAGAAEPEASAEVEASSEPEASAEAAEAEASAEAGSEVGASDESAEAVEAEASEAEPAGSGESDEAAVDVTEEPS